MMSATPSRPWVDAFPEAARWDTPMEIGTLPALLDLAVAEGPARPALSYREVRLDYATLGRLVAGISGGSCRGGYRQGRYGGALPAKHALPPHCLLRRLAPRRSRRASEPPRCAP